MATPAKIVHGTWGESRAALAVMVVLGLGMGSVWEFPLAVARHGGLAFILVWLLAVALLAWPLRMAEIMIGRRSRRGLAEGMAVLTREADTGRGWRVLGWGMALTGFLTLTGMGLTAAHGANWFLQSLGHGPAAGAAEANNGGGPIVLTLLALALAGALAWRGVQALGSLYLGVLAVLTVLILVAAAQSFGSAGTLFARFAPAELGLAGVLTAARFALYTLGGGLGVLFLVGTYLPGSVRIAGLVGRTLASQVMLTLLAAVALSPLAGAVGAVPQGAGFQLDALPLLLAQQSGALPWLVMAVQLLAALAAGAILVEPLVVMLMEKGVPRLPAIGLLVGLAAALQIAVWLLGGVEAAAAVGNWRRGLVLLLLLVLALFTGWVMKISHCRKELALPSEGIYNAWRVAVRILVPLAVLGVMARALGLVA